MIKLIATDLDGTLLPTGTEISPENIEAAKKAAAAGVTVTIATGRMYRAALPVAKNLGVDVPIITYNGALIRTVSGKTLFSSFLAPELIREVLDFVEEQGWYMQTYSKDCLYYPEHCRQSDRYEAAQMVKGEAVGWQGLKEHTEEVTKLLCVTDSSEETEQRIAALKERFGDRIAIVRSSAYYAEIVNRGVSKGEGLKKLAELLGVTIPETMALGDAENDLSILKEAGLSVAMGNAVPEVKAVCDVVTGSCEENGWAEAIYEYALKGR